jgi:signal peptidase II
MVTLLTALAVLGGCTAARWYLDRTSRREQSCGGRVRLTALWNEGAAFGLPVPKRLLGPVSAVVLAVLWTQRRRSRLGAGLVLGGGVSNLLERLRHGRVYDYIQFPRAPGCLRRYVYNLADLAVFGGAVLMVLGKRRKRRRR